MKGTWRTPYRSIRSKDHTEEVVPFAEVCLGRKHSEDGAKLNMRWMRGVFVGKLDRTCKFLLLTPAGAMKTRCVRRLEGDNVRGMRQQGARSRNQQSNRRVSWKAADVRKECTCDRTFWTSMDVLQDAQVVWEMGSTKRSAEQELNKKWETRVMQQNSRHLEIRKKIVQEPDVSLKKRKVGEPDISPGEASSLTADTPKGR